MINGGVPARHGGTPLSLDGLFQGKSIYRWMMTGGTPISGNHQMGISLIVLVESRIKPVKYDQTWICYMRCVDIMEGI